MAVTVQQSALWGTSQPLCTLTEGPYPLVPRRYGELDTRWVGQERWNFSLLWPSKRHELLAGCRQVLLVLHGIDTHATVVLNGRHVLRADNAHR